MTVTREAFLVDKGPAARPVEAEAELECVPAAAGLVGRVGGTRPFGCVQ